MGGDTAWEASYADPLRCRPDGAKEELRTHAPPKVEEIQNDLCHIKLVMMHRPTHEPQREKSGEYPFNWHLGERRRLWELRLQIRFQRPPTSKMYFGIELDQFVPVSGMTKQAQKALVSACQKVVGDCYHTVGDDPARTQGEVEPPAFVMPLWAFDQFHEAEPGREPPLTADLSGVGLCRAEGVSKYITALKATINSFSTDKVYTFCFWGVSKFLDIMKWEVVGGLLPGVKLDFNKLCGSPPVYLTIYELPGVSEQDKNQRHLASRKKQYFRAAVWSELKPPSMSAKAAPVQESVDYWTTAGGYGDGACGGGYEHPKANNAEVGALDDLLGLGAADPQPAAKVAAPQQAENVDLLGLF